MGGLVSLRLAQTVAVDGIIVIGTPLALRAPLPLLARALRRLMPFRAKRGSDIQEPLARERHPGLGAFPLASVTELVRLQAEVVAGLARIETPILIAHGRHDRTALPKDAARIHATVASREKELFYLERSGHVATVDHDGPALALAAADFIAHLC
jgi:carboxylesterase